MLPGDTIGSVESLVSVLKSLDFSKASLNVVQTGIGNITEGDLKIAQSINGRKLHYCTVTIVILFVTGIVLGFGAGRSKAIDVLSEKYKVTLLTDDVIYHVLERLKVIRLLT